MRKKTFTEEQIALALREAETGTPLTEVCRKLGVSEQSFYRWKRKYMGMGVAELRRLKQLEEENRKRKKIVADLMLDKQMLQDVLKKKVVRPARRRRLSGYLVEAYRVSERRACGTMAFHRSTVRYRSRARDQTPIRMRLRDLAALQGGGVGGPDEEAAEAGERPAGGPARGTLPQPEVEHGFSVRQPPRRAPIPDPDGSRSR
jgi:putative transposase